MIQKQNTIRRVISLLLSTTMLVGLYCSASLSAHSSDADEMNERKLLMLSEATEYLKGTRKSDGRFGDNSFFFNETAEAVSVLLMTDAEYDASLSDELLTKNGIHENNDSLARYVTAFEDSTLLPELLTAQNTDGGIGMKKGYASDVLDSVLVLEAINRCTADSYSKEGFAIVSYLTENALSDGGWGYSSGSGADPVLTSMAEYQISYFMNIRSYESEAVTEALQKADDYLSAGTELSFDSSKLEKTLYSSLAHLSFAGIIDYKKVMDGLENTQGTDGSFYNSVHLTSLAIKLLEDMNFNSTLKVYDFDTAVSPEKGYFGTDCSITVNYALAYSIAADEDCILKTTVTNGKAVLSEKQTTVTLCKDETLCSGTAAEMVINQMNDDGIKVVTELIEDDKVIKTSEKTITLSDPPVVGKTTLTGFSLNLNKYSAYVGYPTAVKAETELLFATNVENSVKLHYKVTKGNTTVATKEFTQQLLPENSSCHNEGISFKAEGTEGTVYTVTVECLSDDEVVAESSKTFEIIPLPEQEEPGSAPALSVSWISPVMSDYCVYAGKPTDINADALIHYIAAEDSTKNLTITVSDENGIVAEKTQAVQLPAAQITMVDGTAEYPSVKTDEMLSFTVSELGTYIVTAELKENDGTVIISGEEKVTVLDRPKQDLILNSTVVKEENDQSVDLSWNDISGDFETYSYGLKRRIKGQEWESRSIWNESERVRVLNVYPASPYLKGWMTTSLNASQEPAGMGIFDIDAVHIATFNNNPEAYMKDENGSWKYDVVFFGSSDCNSHYDLSAAASKLMHQFADEGRGILFGHDTICVNFGHTNFNSFADELGILVKYDTTVWTSTSVSVIKIGTLTNFPWTIRGTLIIPSCHSYGQYVGGTLDGVEWMSLNTSKKYDTDTNSHSNFYLVTNKNLGMIQTGHSNGQATDDERKILANTLFYLHQKSLLTTARDSSFYDIDAPDAPDASEAAVKGTKAEVNVSTSDRGTTYEYYIEATPENNKDNETKVSNVEVQTVFSGLKGYVVGINDSSKPYPELIQYDADNETVMNVLPAAQDGKAVLSGELPDLLKQYYMHIFAVDNANNVSEETIVPIGRTGVNTSVATDKEVYETGETVHVNTASSAVLFDINADAVLSIYDEFGNLTSVIENAEQVALNKNDSYALNGEWLIPEIYSGSFIAKITWSINGTEIADVETTFKVAENGGVTNSVSIDKSEYLTDEAISILNNISNISTNADVSNLKLNITVSGAGMEDELKFEKEIAVLYFGSRAQYNELIPAGTLAEGSYDVKSDVVDIEGQILSSASARFNVSATAGVMTGTLNIDNDNNESAKTTYSVTNQSSKAVKGAVIIVKISAADTGKEMFVFTETADFEPGQTIDFSKVLDITEYDNNNYIGVLSVRTGEDETQLDNDLFEIQRIVDPIPQQESDNSVASDPQEPVDEPSPVESVVEQSSKDNNSVTEHSTENTHEVENSDISESSSDNADSGIMTGDNSGFIAAILVLLMTAGGLTVIVIVGGKRKCKIK